MKQVVVTGMGGIPEWKSAEKIINHFDLGQYPRE